MNLASCNSPISRLSRFAIALAGLLAAFALSALPSQAAPVVADAVLLQNSPAPWSDEFNEEAMEAVFGEDWEVQAFAAVQADADPGGLFAPHVHFIWIEASELATVAGKTFVDDHEPALKAFVERGGRLFINSATNQEIDIDYDGRTIGLDNTEDFTEAAESVAPSHPIFHGPATPNATSWTGTSFAHGRVTGPGVTPLIIGTENEGPVNDAIVLAEYSSGSGRVALGSMTTVEFHTPGDAAESLRINLIEYLSAIPEPLSAIPEPQPESPAPKVPSIAPPPPVDTTKPAVRLAGIPKACVRQGFRFIVRVRDAGGVGIVRVKLGGKLIRKVNGNGKAQRVIKVPVRRKQLKRPGRHRVKVIARDLSGNVKRKSANFKVCK